jgi:CheY-like chemotaxis protein
VRALVIEDDEIFRQFLTEILEDRAIEVVQSPDGVAGYEKARSTPYDLIILDVRTPGLLGTEIAEALKQNDPGIRIILISAFADETLRKSAAKLRMPLLSKPFSSDDLFQVIDEAKDTLDLSS